MKTTRAWEQLHDPQYCGRLNMVELYDLMIRAGLSEDEAQEAANQRGLDRLEAGVTM